MINMIRGMFGQKAGVRVTVRTFLQPTATLQLQEVVRSYNLKGWVQMGSRGLPCVIELEGPKHKLQQLIVRLQQERLSHEPIVMEVGWTPYEGKFETFRVAM